ncbi:MAG: BatA domain-containing protein [Planctomycetota bacterium]
MLTFLNPIAFWGFALAAPIILLYLVRRRMRREVVPTIALWERAAARDRTHPLFFRIQHILSLLAQLAILALLVLALARPVWSARAARESRWAVVLDTSASMGAVERGGRTRLAMAAEHLRRTLAALPEFPDLTVLTSSRPPAASGPLRSARALDAFLAGVAPSAVTIRLAEAAGTARGILGEIASGRRLLVLTDGQDSDTTEVAKSGAEVVAFGEASANVSLEAFDVAPERETATDEVLFVLKNHGDAETAVEVVLSLNFQTFKVYPEKLAPGERLVRRHPLMLSERGLVTAHLAPGDALAADDTAFAVAESFAPAPVVVAAPQGRANGFLMAALREMGGVVRAGDVRVVAPEDLPEKPGPRDIWIFDRVSPPREMTEGRFLFWASPPERLPLALAGTRPGGAIAVNLADHPLVRFVSFRNLVAPTLTVVKPAEALALPAVTSAGPILAAKRTSSLGVVYVGVDLAASNLALLPDFPILLRNILIWLDEPGRRPVPRAVSAGESVEPAAPLPPAVREVTVRRPAGPWGPEAAWTLHVRDGNFTFARTEIPGPYRFEIAGKAFWTAANFDAPEESDIRPRYRTAGRPAVPPAPPAPSAPLAPWLLAAAAVLLVVEWVLYHRRRIE